MCSTRTSFANLSFFKKITVAAVLLSAMAPLQLNAQATGTAYVSSGAVVDLAAASITARIPGTDSVLKVSPDGTRIYQSATFGLDVIDSATGQVIKTVPVGSAPVSIAISPDGSRVYASQPNTAAQPGVAQGLYVIDAATNAVTAIIPIPGPQRVAVAPDNSRVYVGSNGRGIAVIDPATDTITASISIVGANLTGIAFAPDSTHAYVGEFFGPFLYEIDARANALLKTVSLTGALGGGVGDVVISPDGAKLYAGNDRTGPTDPARNVFVLDTATDTVTTQIPVSFPSEEMALSTDGASLLVADSETGNLIVASIATDLIVEALPVTDPCCHAISGVAAKPPRLVAPKLSCSPAALNFFFQQGAAGPVSVQQIHVVSDSAQVTFSFKVEVSIADQWMSASASSNSSPADITVAVDPANLQAGIYSGDIRIVSPDASNTPVLVPVTLIIAPPAHDQSMQFPPGQVGIHPTPGPQPQRLSLVPDSSTAFSVLLEQDRTVVSTSDLITSDVTITNNWQAWYFVSVQPVGSVGQNMPSSFLIGPGGQRTYQLTFRRGDSIIFFADATINVPPVSDQDYKLLAVYGAELLWRGTFGSPMPQNLADFALSVASKENPLVHLAVAAAKGDIVGMTTALDDIAGDPILSTQLTALGLPIIKKVNLLTQAQRLFRILQFEIDELIAALKFPNDTLTITAK